MVKTTGRVICARCRHPRPLHSNGKTRCLARGCKHGPDGTPCPEFMEQLPVAEPQPVPAAAFVAPAYGEDLAAS